MWLQKEKGEGGRIYCKSLFSPEKIWGNILKRMIDNLVGGAYNANLGNYFYGNDFPALGRSGCGFWERESQIVLKGV